MKLPHILIYTDALDDNVGGSANGPIIRIKPKYRDDAGILAHELVHVRQWYAGFLLGAIAAAVMYQRGMDGWPMVLLAGAMLHPLATFFPAYRLWKEVQAYKEQAKYYADDRLPLFAQFIAHSYGLDITPEQAYAALTKD